MTNDLPDAEALFKRGSFFYEQGRFDAAIDCYDKALEINARDANTWNSKGRSLIGLNRFDSALACFERALQLNPRHTKALFNKGLCLSELGRSETALSCYDEVLEIDPHDTDAWINKGFCLCSLGRYENALICFDKALELNPQNAIACYDKGFCLYTLNRLLGALDYFETALRIDPQYPAAWFYKALTEDSLGRKKDAVRSYQRYIELAPPQYPRDLQTARMRLRELQRETPRSLSNYAQESRVKPKDFGREFRSNQPTEPTMSGETLGVCPICRGTGRQKIIQWKTVMEPQTVYEQVTQFQFGRPVRVTVPRTVMKQVQKSQYLMVVCPKCKGSGRV